MRSKAPFYLLEESRLRGNLAMIRKIAEDAGVEFILAFKAYALWKTFPIFREYINSTTASSPYEARLAYEEFGERCHTYSPAYEDETFGEILRCSSHITFNSLTQYEHFWGRVKAENQRHDEHQISVGLRINPEHSPVETLLYNPCAPGSRFGILAEDLPETLPEGIEGFHCHVHCESSSHDLEETLRHVEAKFGKWLPRLKWLNLGGGHLVTREGYDTQHLTETLRKFKASYPNLHIILEPGSAFGWDTGQLVAKVVDIVENNGIRTAILNVSFTCHMPDCLEMPYWPRVRNAELVFREGEEKEEIGVPSENVYRLGGNSCLSGDWMGRWRFQAPLSIGDEVVFEDMLHYTTVKTNMFNGIHHPSIILKKTDGQLVPLRHFTYEDYRDRMD